MYLPMFLFCDVNILNYYYYYYYYFKFNCT